MCCFSVMNVVMWGGRVRDALETPPLERMRRNRHKARLREQQQRKKKEENKRYICLFVYWGWGG